jgi:uncharacterized RDD family membrane protein YckC
MNNSQLATFIQDNLKNGFSKEQIKNHLLQNSWQENQIQEAFDFVESLTVTTDSNTEMQVASSQYQQGNISQPTVSDPIVYAGFWLRFLASVIDSVILSIVFALVSTGFGFLVSDEDLAFIPTIISIIIAIAYFTILESGRKSATFGKSIVGLKVLDVNYQHISFLRALGRYAAKIPSMIIFMIGFLMAGFTAKKQGLHDILSGCVVIRAEQKKIWPIVVSIIVTSIAIVSLMGYFAYSMLSGFFNMFSQDNSGNTKILVEDNQVNKSEETQNYSAGENSQYVRSQSKQEESQVALPVTHPTRQELDEVFSKKFLVKEENLKKYFGNYQDLGPAIVSLNSDSNSMSVYLADIPNLQNLYDVSSGIYLESVKSKDNQEIFNKTSSFATDEFFIKKQFSRQFTDGVLITNNNSIYLIDGATRSDIGSVKGVVRFKIPLDSSQSNFYEKEYQFFINVK